MKRIEFGGEWIEYETDGKGNGALSSSFSDSWPEWNGIGSLLLAMVCEGIEINTPQMIRAIETAMDACSNNED